MKAEELQTPSATSCFLTHSILTSGLSTTSKYFEHSKGRYYLQKCSPLLSTANRYFLSRHFQQSFHQTHSCMSAAYAALFLGSIPNSVTWFLLDIIFDAILMTFSALLAASIFLLVLYFLTQWQSFCSFDQDVCALKLFPNYFMSFTLLFPTSSSSLSNAFTLYLCVASVSFSWAI